MNMKLSYRDKVIFIVAIVIIILVAGFFLLIKPNFREVESAQATLQSKQQERDDTDAKIGTLPTIIDSLKAAAQEVGETQEMFMPEQDPDENENYIRAIMHELNINVNSMTTSYTAAGNINRYTVTPTNILIYDNKMNADIYQELPQVVYDVRDGVYSSRSFPTAQIGITTMNISFDISNNTQVNRLIDRLAEDGKTIYLNTISTQEEGSTEEQDTGSVSLTLYSVTPLNVEKVMEESTEVQPIEAAPAEETPAE